jgi:ribose transport system permease protein
MTFFSGGAVQLRGRLPTHLLGEILTKLWIDSVVPVTIMGLTLVAANIYLPGYLGAENLAATGRQFAEFGLVALGMTIVIYCGGIDLSVGAVYAAANFAALLLVNVFNAPVVVVLPATLLLGAALGAVNGYLVGVLKVRAFLVTLATMVIFRAALELIVMHYGESVALSMSDDKTWEFVGEGTIIGVPLNAAVLAVIAVAFHFILTRSRVGWRLQAVGGSRRSAYNVGINVQATVFFAYVVCGMLAALGGFFYAARQGSVGDDTGVGLEFAVVTAVVLGGVSLGGGRGSIVRALAGSVIALVVINFLVRLGLTGGYTSTVLGCLLLAAIGFDTKWNKNRHKLLQKVYVSPVYYAPRYEGWGEEADRARSPYALNNRLGDVEVLGYGEVDGPEDVILDDEDRIYTGTREGRIIRLSGPGFSHAEVFADLGGRPFGLAFDADKNLIVCVGAMGVYGVRPDGATYRVTDQTNRTRFSILDDSSLRMADDLDIAPDGKIYFSDATTRYDAHTWLQDAVEARPNGRLVCHDPKSGRTRTVLRGLRFSNGVCLSHDGRSMLFAESFDYSISRLWLAGPKEGQVEKVIPNLPGYPDNINRASDGNYWLALIGMRSPTWDLSMTRPSFRLRMIKQVPHDEWLCPSINIGCVVKFSPSGEILDCLWDEHGVHNPMITSMREHKGWLYLGGMANNRITRVRLPDADQAWTGSLSYWGSAPPPSTRAPHSVGAV